MARTLSQDLRDRVVAAIDGGLSCLAAAARIGVSVSSASRWRQLALKLVMLCPNRAAVTGIQARSKHTAASSGG